MGRLRSTLSPLLDAGLSVFPTLEEHGRYLVATHRPLLNLMQTQKFEFVSLDDGQGKPRDFRRRLIRGHCMRGKNKREDSRRTQRKVRQSARSRNRPHRDDPPADLSIDANAPDSEQKSLQPKARRTRPSISHLQVQGGFHGAIREWSALVGLKSVVYPIEAYVEIETQGLPGMVWLFLDDSFLYSVRFAVLAFQDVLRGNNPVPDTWSHLQRAIALLNRRLGLGGASLHSSTAYTVILLALTASLLGDHTATKLHLSGVHKIVQLLGGLRYLEGHPLLHYKLSLLELSQYANTGYCLPPVGEVPWTPLFPRPQAHGDDTSETLLIQTLCNSKLAIVFYDLRCFTRFINKHLEQGRTMKLAALQSQLNHIQMRLLQPQACCDSFTESLRLGMLAFISFAFKLPKCNAPYEYLCRQLRFSLLAIDPAIASKVPSLMLWISILGCMSGLKADEPQLLSCREYLIEHKMPWGDIYRCLQSIMWIDYIHSGHGQVAFMNLTAEA